MKPELLRAALEPILLEVIARGEATYGYEIARAIHQATDGKLLTQEGTLYPALHRLEKSGLLKAEWRHSPEGRRRKHYKITAEGRKRLAKLRSEWQDFSECVKAVLGLTRWCHGA